MKALALAVLALVATASLPLLFLLGFLLVPYGLFAIGAFLLLGSAQHTATQAWAWINERRTAWRSS